MNTFKAPYITKAEIDSAASDFTLKYWKDKSSPIDVEKIAEIDLRLNIIPVKNLLNDFGVDAFISRDMKSITIDYDIYDLPVSESRRRFSIAHEIGHLVLHSEVYKSMTFTNPDEWIETVREIPEDQYSFLEFQAYEFAGRLASGAGAGRQPARQGDRLTGGRDQRAGRASDGGAADGPARVCGRTAAPGGRHPAGPA